MNGKILPAALAALILSAAGAAAQDATITQPPAASQDSPATGPGEQTEAGQGELQSQTTDDPINRVLPEVGAAQSADAIEQQTGLPAEPGVGGTVVVPAN